MAMTDITLMTDSLYGLFLSTLGLIISNHMWSLLTDTGLFALPFIFNLIGLFMKAREQGADEGNKGKLLINWLENYLYFGLWILFATCVPIFNVSFNVAPHKNDMCEVSREKVQPNNTLLGASFNQTTLNGEQPKMPLWWAFVYSVSQGITNGMIKSTPCKPDIRNIQLEVNDTKIKDPILKNELLEFHNYCYLPARNRFIKQMTNDGVTLNAVENDDLNWVGSQLLLKGGFYGKYHAKYPKKRWRYRERRDFGFGSDPAAGGFPMCDDWWDNPSKGLKQLLLAQYEPSVKDKAKSYLSWLNTQRSLKRTNATSATRDDMLVRQLVSGKNLAVKESDLYGVDYTDAASGGSTAGTYVKKATGAASAGAAGLITTISLGAVKKSLPIVQGIILFFIMVITPLVVAIGGYKLKPVIILSLTQFGVIFLTFVWWIIRWLDTWVYAAMHSSTLGVGQVFTSTSDEMFQVVIGTMYVGVPTLMFVALGWTGIKVGDMANKALSDAQNKAQSGANTATSVGKEGGNQVKEFVRSKNR